MRISDWSSDVCSSDLPRWRAARRSASSVEAPCPYCPPLEFRRVREPPRCGHFARQKLLRRTKTRYASFDVGRPRSEEHTSELQSLMRISYAVFSLQKTTHKHSSRTPFITPYDLR